MHSLRVLLVLLGFVLLAVAQQPPVSFGSSRLSARVDPSVGTVQIWEAGTDRIFTHKYLNLVERQNSNTVNQVSFDNQIYTVRSTTVSPSPTKRMILTPILSLQVSNAEVNKYQGINATAVTLTASVSVRGTDNSTSGATLVTTFWIFQEDGDILFNNQTIPVGPEQMYIAYQLGGWPIRSQDNIIDFVIRLSTAGRSGSLDDQELRLEDGGSLSFANVATGSNFPGGSAQPLLGISTSESTVDVTIRFDASTNINYAALWSVEEEGSGSGSSPSAASFLTPLITRLF